MSGKVVTGKLGTGKTLVSLSEIQEAVKKVYVWQLISIYIWNILQL